MEVSYSIFLLTIGIPHEKVSVYDQEMPQSQTADQPMNSTMRKKHRTQTATQQQEDKGGVRALTIDTIVAVPTVGVPPQ